MATAHGYLLLHEAATEVTAATAPTTSTAGAAKAHTDKELLKNSTVYFTKGNWESGTGCYHCEKDCWTLAKAATGIDCEKLCAVKSKGLRACKVCADKPTDQKKDIATELSVGTDSTDDNVKNYMFSVTVSTDVQAAILANCGSTEEAELFEDMKLAFQHEDRTLSHYNKTGYYWTITEIPELKRLIDTGKHAGEISSWGNWTLD